MHAVNRRALSGRVGMGVSRWLANNDSQDPSAIHAIRVYITRQIGVQLSNACFGMQVRRGCVPVVVDNTTQYTMQGFDEKRIKVD
jgi:hypothetical protein